MKRIIQIVFFATLLFGVVGLARAQQPSNKSNDGWEAVNGDMMVQPGETIPGNRLVGAAYGFICAAVVVWVASVARRARRLEDEVDELKKKLAARG